MTDFWFGLLIGVFAGFFPTFIYFFSYYLGRHPDRAILALRENRLWDNHKILITRALLNGLDGVYRWPKGFERCEASDYGDHLAAGPYEDGSDRCYWCGVVAQKVEVQK